MGIKLSNTKREKYLGCPARYNFHYNLKYRTKTLSSALTFGVGIDEALNRMLLDKKEDHNTEEKEMMKLSPEETFIKHFTHMNHNGENVHIPSHANSSYAKADFDHTMLSEEDLETIGHDLEFCKAHVEWYHEEIKKYNKMDLPLGRRLGFDANVSDIRDEDITAFNLINWCSLKRKGLMIIETYRNEIMPQIYKVYSIQERVNLPNNSGDTIDGVIDFVASFTEDPDTVYVVDNKTSAQAYNQKKLTESDQLHLYAYYKELENIAYIVCEKGIRKKDPRVRISILKGSVDEDFTGDLLDSYEETLGEIKEENFNPDFKSGCTFFTNNVNTILYVIMISLMIIN